MTTGVQCSGDPQCSCPAPHETGVCHEHAHQSLLHRSLPGQPGVNQAGMRHLKTLGQGRGGRQRSIGDLHEIPRGALAVERWLFRGVISRVDVHGYHQAVEVSRQGWPSHLCRYRVADANGPMGGP